MSIKKSIICFALLAFIVGCGSIEVNKKNTKNNDFEIVEANGSAAIIDNNVESAKRTAISDALKNAIHLVVGVYVSANTIVSKSMLIEEEIKSNTYGYIESYEIIKEYLENGFYHVKIKAKVKKENLQIKALGFENEIDKIGNPSIYINVENNSDSVLEVVENTFISEFKKDLFRVSFSSSDVDLIVNAKVSTSFNTSEGIGGFISYRCYIDGKIYTSEGEILGGFSKTGASIGFNEIEAKKNALISCVRQVYPYIKDSIILFYSSKRSIKVEVLNISSISELGDLIKFFRNISLVRNVYVKSYENNRYLLDIVVYKLNMEDFVKAISKLEMFDIKKVSGFKVSISKK